jgi:predicted metalloprotease
MDGPAVMDLSVHGGRYHGHQTQPQESVMRLGRTSSNVEDRRGMYPGRMGGFGGSGVRLGGLGLGGLLVVAVLGYLLTGSPLGLLGGGGPGVPNEYGGGMAPAPGPPGDAAGTFASQVLADTEDTWTELFAQGNRRYQKPTLVLFSDAVSSACGMTSAAVGPFYCPGDSKVYIDLSFYRELDRRFGAPGDFAQAYVIAHEVGHHVQNQLGVFDQSRRGVSEADANAISVVQELQADCLAGVWGHYAAKRGVLDPGDVDEGLNAAAAIGDDRIQRRTQGHVTPETWTHGSSEQRVRWFKTGLQSGQVASCDGSRIAR